MPAGTRPRTPRSTSWPARTLPHSPPHVFSHQLLEFSIPQKRKEERRKVKFQQLHREQSHKDALCMRISGMLLTVCFGCGPQCGWRDRYDHHLPARGGAHTPAGEPQQGVDDEAHWPSPRNFSELAVCCAILPLHTDNTSGSPLVLPFRTMHEYEGMRGLWRGLGPALSGVIPSRYTQFGHSRGSASKACLPAIMVGSLERCSLQHTRS